MSKKNILQDVMPPRRRSIRDIPLNNKKNNNSRKGKKPSDFPIPIESKRGGNNRLKLWLIVIAIIVVAYFLFSAIFSGAEVIISPKQEKVNFNANLTAVKSDIKSTETGVPFSVLTVEETGFEKVSEFKEKEVAKKASGKIVIFNEYGSSPQRLVINTRFETKDGKIYRIPKSVIVPGRTVDKKGKITPGSIEVTVYADSPGKEYNIGLADFTVPGFKGTDRFSKFYAKSKTKMSGGYSGLMKVVAEDKLDRVRDSIHTNLKKELTNKLYSKIPESSVIYPGGIYVSYDSQENVNLENSVKVIEKGVMKAVVFNKLLLSNYVAKNVVSDLGDSKVEISNIEDLNFKILNKEYTDITNDESFDFNLGGSANFVWVFDKNQIKNDLAGQSKNNVDNILSKYLGIEKTKIIVSPFWKRSLPNNIDKIKITENLGN